MWDLYWGIHICILRLLGKGPYPTLIPAMLPWVQAGLFLPLHESSSQTCLNENKRKSLSPQEYPLSIFGDCRQEKIQYIVGTENVETSCRLAKRTNWFYAKNRRRQGQYLKSCVLRNRTQTLRDIQRKKLETTNGNRFHWGSGRLSQAINKTCKVNPSESL